MDGKTIINSPESPIEQKKEKRQWPLKWYDWVCIAFVLVGVIFFMLHQNYDASQKIASDVWGQLGDFIGGILGTFIAYIGIRLLVETLNAQRDANDTASKTYEDNKKVFIQQQFDGNFNTLLKLYEETIESYSADTSKRGREELHSYAEKLKKDISPTEESYSERVSVAAEGFNHTPFGAPADASAAKKRDRAIRRPAVTIILVFMVCAPSRNHGGCKRTGCRWYPGVQPIN